MSKEQFYDVTMTVTVRRRVLATSESEAREKVDEGDMVHEIKNYSLNSSLTAELVEGVVPDEFDRIDEIAEEIVRNSSSSMNFLRREYAEIKKFNKQLKAQGLPEYTPMIFGRMTDSFMDALKK